MLGETLNTVLEDIDLLDRCAIAEKVEMHKGDIFTARVLHDSLDAGITDTAQGDIERRVLIGLDWQGIRVLGESQKRCGNGSKTHCAWRSKD